MRPVSPIELAHTSSASPEAETAVFANMTGSIDAAFDSFWEQEFRERDYFTPAEVAEKRQEALDRERKFAEKVCSAVLAAAESHEGPVTIIFDVDETIVKKYFTDTGMRDVVRPAFAPMVRALDSILGDRLEVGILTTRGQSHLEEELHTPTYLGEVIDKVNPDFVISARDGTLAKDKEIDYLDSWGSEEQRLEALEEFVDPVKVHETEMSSRYGWFSNKLLILHEIARFNPDRSFVYVDDMPCAAVINHSNPQVSGVQVYEDSGFFSI